MKRLVVMAAVVVALALGSAGSASADSFNLNVIYCSGISNTGCLPKGTVAGTVDVTQQATNVVLFTVSLTYPGITFHDSGLDTFSFNGPSGLAASAFNVTNDGGSSWSFLDGKGNADGAGTFMYWFNCASAPNGCAGNPTVFAFTVTGSGLTPSLFETTNNGASHVDFAANVAQRAVSGCTGIVGGGNGTSQSTPDGGFTSGTDPCNAAPIPEPATMFLLGSGLLAAGFRLRPRRKR